MNRTQLSIILSIIGVLLFLALFGIAINRITRLSQENTKQEFKPSPRNLNIPADGTPPFELEQPKQNGKNIYVKPDGVDTNDGTSMTSPLQSIQKAIDIAYPGDTINLGDGTYFQDFASIRDGNPDAPITIKGSSSTIIKGNGAPRIIEIRHDFITLEGFMIDGKFDESKDIDGYRKKLIYVIGAEPNNGVQGMRLLRMNIQNSAGECVRMRYFAQNNEIAESTIAHCGIEDFVYNSGKKNGEGIYIGTAPEQRSDGKNPTADVDQSSNNWIHNNTISTFGNECVDVKEGSSGNIVENNKCSQQKDPESGGLDSRGNGNIFRNNEIFDNVGAGIRLGGDAATDGIENIVYGNIMRNNQSGGIKILKGPQKYICNNTFINSEKNMVGPKVNDLGDSCQ